MADIVDILLDWSEYDEGKINDAREKAANEIKWLREALDWYDEQVRICRANHSGGDKARHALAEDGGRRARAALKGDSNE